MIATTEHQSEPEQGTAAVSIVIPCRAEYVAVARLAILAVANRLEYSYDEVEDIRLAVGEACTHAVERAQVSVADSGEPTIRIECIISPTGLEIGVHDNIVPPKEGAVSSAIAEDLGFDKQDLGALLMEILVDKFSVSSSSRGTSVLLLKHAPHRAHVSN